MTEIIVNEFVGYGRQALEEFIQLQEESNFKIVISRWPKISPKHAANIECLEFLLAAYAGHCIAEACKTFTYNIPLPGSDEPFYFLTEVNDQTKFIDALYNVPRIGITDHVDPDYEELASDFNADSIAGKIKAHTIGLVHLAKGLSEDVRRDFGTEEWDEE